MVVALWRRGNRCRAPMGVETLRRRTPSILGYRLIACHLLSNRTLRLALGQWGQKLGQRLHPLGLPPPVWERGRGEGQRSMDED